MPVCEHKNFGSSVAVSMYEKTRVLEVSVKCVDCGKPFHFEGVHHVGIHMSQPSTTPDKTVLHCPIKPGALAPGEENTQPLKLEDN